MALSRELRLRLVSAALLAPAALLVVWLGGPALLAGLALAAVLIAREWCGLVDEPVGEYGLAALAVAALVLGFLGLGGWALALLAAAAVALAAAARGAGAPARVLAGLGPIYVGVPPLALQALRATPATGLELTLWLLLVVWTTDVSAYFAGRAIGGPKLAPRLSPGKTWAGLSGGMVGAALVGAALTAAAGAAGSWRMAVVAAAVAVVAQIGDLFESWLKRRRGRKDSGDLIPGHGGLLDRIDGLMTATPMLVALTWLNAE